MFNKSNFGFFVNNPDEANSEYIQVNYWGSDYQFNPEYIDIHRIKIPSKHVDVDTTKNFWKETYPDGITVADIANELRDYHFLLEQLPEIYMNITGGRLSKPFYHSSTVIEAVEESKELAYDYGVSDERERILSILQVTLSDLDYQTIKKLIEEN